MNGTQRVPAPISDAQWQSAFDGLFNSSGDRALIVGRLGVKTSSSTADLAVATRPGYYYVSTGLNGELGQSQARDGCGVALVAWQTIWMVRENNELVIVRATTYGGTGGGGGATNLDALTDVTLTTPANGNTLQYNSSTGQWINVVPPGGSGGAPSPHAHHSAHHSGLLPWDDLDFTGSDLADLATRQHSVLQGVSPDQHHTRQHNIITGDGSGAVHSITGSAFDLVGATATNTLGLLTPSSNPGLAGAILRTDAAGGLTIAGGMLAVTPATSKVTIDSNLLVADTAADTVSFGGPTYYSADMHFTGGNRIIDATNSLKLAPLTDLTLDPGGVVAYADGQESRTNTFTDSVTGILGFRLFDNSSGGNTMQLTTNSLKADNIFARKFQADEQRVARGSWFLTYSYGIVETAFTVPAVGSTVDVWFEEAPGLGSFKLFSADHWILFRIIDVASGIVAATMWFQAVDADGTATNDYITRQDQTAAGVQPSHLARQQWRLKRMQGGATGIVVAKGETASDFALPPHMEGAVSVPGQGIVYATSLNEDSGPFIQVQTFESVVANVPQFKNRVRMGNLSGTVDYTAAAWGLAAGDDLGVLPSAGFSGVAIDAVQGTRLFNTDLALYSTGGIKTVVLDRTAGLAFANDSAWFNDPLRFVGWYDDITSISGQPTVGLAGAKSVAAGVTTRSLQMRVFANDGSESFIDIFSQGNLGVVDQLMLSRGRQSDNTQGPVWSVSAAELHLTATTVVGVRSIDSPNDKPVNPSPLTVLSDNAQVDHRAGATVMQLGSGDAVLHFNQRAYTGFGPPTYVSEQWISIGIDRDDGNKFKISAFQSLGTNDFFTYDPATNVVTIPGISGGGGGGTPPAVTAGFGIDVSPTGVISVDSDVATSGTAILTDTGSGLQGGGDLSASRHLSILAPSTGGLLVGTGGIIINDSLAGSGLVMSPSKVMSVELGSGSPGLAFDGADRLIVDATVVRTPATIVRNTLTLTAGAGLTGGGDLSANRTFNVATLAGSGIIVNADDIAVDFTVVARNVTLTAGAGLTGGGDLSANRTFNVVAGNGTLTVNADDMVVNQGFAFAWAGAQTWAQAATFNNNATFNTGVFTFNTDPQVNANLDFIGGARAITTAAGANLSLLPGGDVILDPSGNDVLPGGTSRVDLGDYNRKWLSVFATELYVETLVASNVMATIGGRVMITPTTSLIADVNTSQTTIDLKQQIAGWQNGTYVYLESAPGGVAQVEAMRLTNSGTAITGGYRYTVTRNVDGTGANAWDTGDAVVSLGRVAGDGYIDLASVSTIHTKIGPTITIYGRTATTAWNSVAPVVTMGNLSSFVDYSATEFGFATGNDLTKSPATGFSGFTADRSNGVRLFNTPLEIYEDANKVIKLDKVIGLSFEKNGLGSTSANISWYDTLPDTPGAAPTGTPLAQISLGRATAAVENTLTFTAGNGGVGGNLGSILMTASQSGAAMSTYLEPGNFHVYGPDGITDRLVVTGAGSVAIGLPTPSQHVHARRDQTATTQVEVENQTAAGGALFTAAVDGGALFQVGKYGSSRSYKILAAGDGLVYNSVRGNIGILNDYASGGINFAGGGSSTPQMVLTAAGKLGLGLTSPSATLQVVQTATTGEGLRVERNLTATSTDSPVVQIIQDHAGDDQDALLIQQDSDSGYGLTVRQTGLAGTAGTYPLARFVYNPGVFGLNLQEIISSGVIRYSWGVLNNSTNYPDMLCFDRGNIGIANNSPANLLHVGPGTGQSLNNFFGVYVAPNATVSTLHLSNTNSLQGGIVLHTGAGYAGTWTNHNFSLRTNNADRLTIDNAGLVGIGTTGPSAQLHVRRDQTTVTAIEAENQTAAGYAMLTAVVDGGAAFQVGKYGSTHTAYKILGTGDSYIYNSGRGDLSFLNDVATGNIKFAAGAASTAQMVLTSAGRLGLGTTTPEVPFDTTGIIRSTGSIGSAATGPGIAVYWNTSSSYGAVVGFNWSTSVYQQLALDGNPLVFNGSASVAAGGSTIVMKGVANNASSTPLAILANGTVVTNSSSLRTKHDIRALPDEMGLEFVMKLRPSLFKYNSQPNDGDFVGLIAEEVLEAGGRSFVFFDEEGQPEGLRYAELTAPLIAAMQQLAARVAELERKLN